MSKESNSASYLSLPMILTLIFLTLKLAKVGVVATWSWWWIFSPILISISIGIIVLIVTGILFVRMAKKERKSEWSSKLDELIKKAKQ